jgi:membrane-associated phospholipid phosphatase
MDIADRILEIAITIVLIIGGYQFYFFAQRQRWYPARRLETRFDAMISYDPRWVWVYSGLYYPMILLAGGVQTTWHDYAWTVGCFLTLLAVQVPIFLFFPIEIPASWREQPAWVGTRSQQFMDVVWSLDKLRNSMPSMHVSMATVVDLTIGRASPILGYICVIFPVLIAVSALKTKQHYVVDVVPGAVIGAFVFWFYHSFIWIAS